MSLLVVGTVALDTVETPTDVRENILGGSAVFFSYAAGFFGPVRLIGPIGEDWPEVHTDLLRGHGVDVAGIQKIAGGKTFRWRGKYRANMNDRDTLEVHLNVLQVFKPQVPATFRDSKLVFLANFAPALQLEVLEQVPHATLRVADTMDLWIETQRDELLALLRRIDGIVLNDGEARMLVDDDNIIRAGRKVLELGPRFAVIKKGEHGALFFTREECWALPAYPVESVVDPTGAGDTFAGAMMGALAESGDLSSLGIKRALAYGTVMAGFNVEDFSLDRMKRLDRAQLDARYEEFRRMLAL